MMMMMMNGFIIYEIDMRHVDSSAIWSDELAL